VWCDGDERPLVIDSGYASLRSCELLHKSLEAVTVIYTKAYPHAVFRSSEGTHNQRIYASLLPIPLGCGLLEFYAIRILRFKYSFDAIKDETTSTAATVSWIDDSLAWGATIIDQSIAIRTAHLHKWT
jgi:hypothetical protein